VNCKVLYIFPDWEERAYEGFLRDIESQRFQEIVLLNYLDGLHPLQTKSIAKKIEDYCLAQNILLVKLTLQKNDLIHNWAIIGNFILGRKVKDEEVFIDITTTPREVLWILLYNLGKQIESISYFYHQPKYYNKDWLTRESESPRLLLKHSGIIDPFKQTALLIITGFDSERVNQIVNYFDPKKVILAIQAGKQFDNEIRNNDGLFKIEGEKEILNLDAYDGDLGFDTINDKIGELIEDFNIVIASLGPKLTALSMYKLFLFHPEIALCYIPCKDFNIEYSKGIGSTITGNLEIANKKQVNIDN
jgi:hypothetical protein